MTGDIISECWARSPRNPQPDDPRVGRWAETTRMLVEKGLFKDSHAIGREGAWNERLAQAGLAAVGDEVVSA